MRRAIVAGCLLLLAALIFASGASVASARPPEKAIWGPLNLADGTPAFPVYRQLGVDVYEVQLDWDTTATRRPADPRDPNDPAYRWPATLDDAVRQAQDAGIQVALLVKGTPGWANGAKTPDWRPTNVRDYADFLVAAAKRYPEIRRWMIWGEPTRQGNYQPMPANSRTGPRSYAELLDAAYGALKGVSRSNIVIGGMTFTVGLVFPADFNRWMRLPNGQPPRMDWYGHNPFSTRFPAIRRKPYVRALRDIDDLDTLHRDLAAAYRGRRVPRIWVSEFTVSSDRPNRAFNFAVSRREQARWLTAAYRLADKLPYVAGMGWFNLQDEADDGSKRGLTTGLLSADGARKPAFAAYQRAP
jgi:hypothetical protein